MKLTSYILNNLTQKKGRAILMILGIILASNGMIVIRIMTERYSIISDTFFTPFNEYDQIVERGTDYIQLLPISSSLDLNHQSNIDDFFNTNTIPCLLVPNNKGLSSFQSNYIMGLNITDMPILLDKLSLSFGTWPEKPEQVIVGNYWADNNNLSILNKTFQITGAIFPTYSFLDRMIYIEINQLQNLTGLLQRVSLFFIPNTIEQSPDLITNFETAFPQMDVLTIKEIDDIKGGLSSFINNIGVALSSFSTISALVFIFSLETINIYSRKKDFDIFIILGIPKIRLFALIIVDSIFLILIGLIIGIPSSLLNYGVIWTNILISLGNDNGFITIFIEKMRVLFNAFPINIFISTSLLISICGLISTLIPTFFALRNYNLDDIKQKF